jgi:nitroreductase
MTKSDVNAGLAAAGTTAALAPHRVLPPPNETGGITLMAALKLRRSVREYADTPLPLQALSNLLWAGFGVNRPGGDRTAPYWRHVMVIDVYAVMADGVWLYDPKAHALLPYLKDDIRADTGMQDFTATAPLNLVYVAHGDRMTDVSPEDRRLYASVDSAFIGQNVYLYCASEGLASVFRGAVDYAKLARRLKLPEQQFVTFAQTVGYAKAASL